MKINWKVRFSRDNALFLFRFFAALFLPVLTYLGLSYEDLTSWGALWGVIIDFVSNPFLLFLTAFNAFNVVPDPIVKGISDSPQGLSYNKPKDNGGNL